MRRLLLLCSAPATPGGSVSLSPRPGLFHPPSRKRISWPHLRKMNRCPCLSFLAGNCPLSLACGCSSSSPCRSRAQPCPVCRGRHEVSAWKKRSTHPGLQPIAQRCCHFSTAELGCQVSQCCSRRIWELWDALAAVTPGSSTLPSSGRNPKSLSWDVSVPTHGVCSWLGLLPTGNRSSLRHWLLSQEPGEGRNGCGTIRDGRGITSGTLGGLGLSQCKATIWRSRESLGLSIPTQALSEALKCLRCQGNVCS